MYLYSFRGEQIVNDKSQLFSVFTERSKENANVFILTFEESGFPQLSVFIRNNFCVIYYLDDKGNSYVSYNRENRKHGSYPFYENDESMIELAYESILDVRILNNIASVFYDTKKRPMCIDWIEL